MDNKSKLTEWTRLKFWIATIIALGIFFRLVNLDHKVFWGDEGFTALRISGYTGKEFNENLYGRGESVSSIDLQKYLRPNPDKGMQDVINGLAFEDPHVPVLYIVLVRFWAQCFGGSIAVLRSLSAVFGVLSLPAMYWLCLELFESRSVAWMGVALIAVSPFHVLYSQEARSYSLWTLMILLSSALLLRSLRQSTPLHWFLYAISIALGIYSHLFYIFVALGHGIYVLVLERFRLSRTLIAYLISSAFGAATFVPWAIILFANRVQAEKMVSVAWRDAKFSLPSLVSMWVGNISRLFFDVGLGSQDSFRVILPFIPLLLSFILLVIYSVYFLMHQAKPQSRLFVGLLLGTSTLFFLASDFLIGGRLSGMPRYSIALFIGIQLAVAYTFALKLSATHKRFEWKLLIGIVFSISIFSCAVSVPEKVWWHKGPYTTRYIPQAAAWINQTKNPWVITDQGFFSVPTLAHELKPEIRIALVSKGEVPSLPMGDRNILVFQPSQGLLQTLKAEGALKPVPGTGSTLYQLVKNSDLKDRAADENSEATSP